MNPKKTETPKRRVRGTLLLLCPVLAAFLLGAAGAVHLARPEGDSEASGRLVGVLITREAALPSDSDRLYAVLTETEGGASGSGGPGLEYRFEGVDALSFFAPQISEGEESYRAASGDPAVSDQRFEIHESDQAERLTLEGAIYVSTQSAAGTFYFHPVYQTEAGAVYAVSGNGVAALGDGTAGNAMSQELSETVSCTEDGVTKERETRVTVHVCYREEPGTVSLLQFDQEHRLLDQDRFAPGELPDAWELLPDTAYVLAETAGSSGNTDGVSVSEHAVVFREIFSPQDSELFAFFNRGDGVCVRQSCSLRWPE